MHVDAARLPPERAFLGVVLAVSLLSRLALGAAVDDARLVLAAVAVRVVPGAAPQLPRPAHVRALLHLALRVGLAGVGNRALSLPLLLAPGRSSRPHVLVGPARGSAGFEEVVRRLAPPGRVQRALLLEAAALHSKEGPGLLVQSHGRGHEGVSTHGDEFEVLQRGLAGLEHVVVGVHILQRGHAGLVGDEELLGVAFVAHPRLGRDVVDLRLGPGPRPQGCTRVEVAADRLRHEVRRVVLDLVVLGVKLVRQVGVHAEAGRVVLGPLGTRRRNPFDVVRRGLRLDSAAQ